MTTTIELPSPVCPRCGGASWQQSAPPPHYAAWICRECNRFIRWKPHPLTREFAGAFVMPFGKYKGRQVSAIAADDRDYLDWAADNFDHNRLRQVIRFYLDHPAVASENRS